MAGFGTGCLFYTCQASIAKTMPAHSLRKVIGNIRPSPLPDVQRSTLPSVPYLCSSAWNQSRQRLGLGPTARVTQICCLGRFVSDTTASLAASEILPTGSVQAPRYYAGRSLRTLRQQSEGGQTDRCLQSIPNSFPPSRMVLPRSIHRVPQRVRAARPPNLLLRRHVPVSGRAGLRTIKSP